MIQTTDNQNELFDVVNERDEVIGVATRGECHSNKTCIHRAAQVIAYNDKGEFFIQKRSQTKDLYPGKWTFSAAGHVEHGSTYLKTIVREISEELGVDVLASDVKRLKKLRLDAEKETEMVCIFLLHHNGPFKINRTEIEEGRWVDFNKLATYPGTPSFNLIINDVETQEVLEKL